MRGTVVITSVLVGVLVLSGFGFSDAYAMTKADLIASISEKTSSGDTSRANNAECQVTNADGSTVFDSDDTNRFGITHMKLKSSNGADLPDQVTLTCAKGDAEGSKTLDVKRFIKVKLTIQPENNSDSFFDVFFDVFTVDSFFDIFTELQVDVEELKGGTEDINIGIGELRADLDAHIAADNDLDPTNEIESIEGNPFGDLQSQIDDKNSEILQIQNDIASVKSGMANFQTQLNAITLSSHQILQCQQQCASLKHFQQQQLQQCSHEASQLGVSVETHCSAEIAARDAPCTCPTTSDPILAEQLEQQIELLSTELATLEEKLETCQFELMVLQTLQNQFTDSGETPQNCNDGNVCTVSFFDSTTGMCVTLPNDGLSCNDGDVTTHSDMCTTNMCVGTPIICDDGNLDTTDVLDPTTGVCIFTLIDNDNDGFGPSTDCDDENSAVHPNAVEVVGDDIDNNCDEIVDNLPPIVNAGLDQTISYGGGVTSCTATFTGSFSDPDGDPLSFQWSGNGFSSVIDSPNSLTTDVTISSPRQNTSIGATLTLAVNDGLQTSSDSVRFFCVP